MIIRTLLVWLLALALPMQGLAAATMASCGQAPHHATPQPAAAGHDQAAAAGHDQADVHSHADADASTHTALHGGDGQPASADGHTCSACASCCSVGAMLNPVPTVPAPDSARTVFQPVVKAIDAFVADGLDRPPRSAFA